MTHYSLQSLNEATTRPASSGHWCAERGRRTGSAARNSVKPWSPDEELQRQLQHQEKRQELQQELQLRQLRHRGASVADITRVMGRSEYATQLRLKKLGIF